MIALNQFHRGGGKIPSAGKYITAGSGNNAFFTGNIPDHQIVNVGRAVLFHAHSRSGIPLGVTVNQKNVLTEQRQSGAEVDTGCCFSNAALLVGESNDFCHGIR